MNNNNFENVGTIFNFVSGGGQNLRGSYNNTSTDETTNHLTTEAESNVIVNDYQTFDIPQAWNFNFDRVDHFYFTKGTTI